MSSRIFSACRDAAVSITTVVVVFTQSSPHASAADYTWTQTAGGAQDWTTGGNWLGGSPPSPVSGDTVDFSTVDILANTTLTLGGTRTATSWKFGDTSGGQTWSVTGNTLTLAGSGANIDVGTDTSISSVLAVTNGTTATATGNGALTLTNTSFLLGGNSGASSQTLDLSNLNGAFSYNNAGGTFQVSGRITGLESAYGNLYLASNSTITASTFGVGSAAGNSNHSDLTRLNYGAVYLGAATAINADTISLGASKAQGTVQYASGGGVENPTLTLRGTDGTSRVGTMNIGTAGHDDRSSTSTFDLTSNITGTSTLDAMIGTLTIGNATRVTTSGSNNNSVTGNFLMGAGTLDATTIVLGKTNTGVINSTGTFTTSEGGIVKVGTLTLGDKNYSANGRTVTGTFNLNGGADLYATTIQRGNNTNFGSAVRSFNWNDGTIHNLVGTDLTIGTIGESAPVTWTIAATGTHAFDIDGGRTGTVNVVLGGSGGTLTKRGEGALILNAANTYSGTTLVSAGTLYVNGSLAGNLTVDADGILGGDGTIGGSLSFNSGADLLFQVGKTLLVNGVSVSFGNFGVSNLIGLDNTVETGTYTLIAGSAAINWANVNNVGLSNAANLGNNKIAYFQSGSMQLVVDVIPEPTAAMLGSIGMVLLLRRRRA